MLPAFSFILFYFLAWESICQKLLFLTALKSSFMYLFVSAVYGQVAQWLGLPGICHQHVGWWRYFFCPKSGKELHRYLEAHLKYRTLCMTMWTNSPQQWVRSSWAPIWMTDFIITSDWLHPSWLLELTIHVTPLSLIDAKQALQLRSRIMAFIIWYWTENKYFQISYNPAISWYPYVGMFSFPRIQFECM